MRSLVFLLTACVRGPEDECGPSDTGVGGCPIDECAADCISVDAGVDCCLAMHGRGLTGHASETLEATCVGGECDSSQYISEETALCVAQVNGLSSGIGECYSGFHMENGTPQWFVSNTLSGNCVSGYGKLLVLDAVSADVVQESHNAWDEGYCE